MQDIIKAMEREQEYLSYRMKNEEPFHLVDAIKECGFETLDEYFEAKKDYAIAGLGFEVIEPSAADGIANVMNAIANKKNTVIFVETEHTFVWNCTGSEFNVDYCEECGIPVFDVLANGGTIVTTRGDLSVGIGVPDTHTSSVNYFLSRFAKILMKYTDQAVEVHGNDILVGGFKVLGSTSYHTNGMFMIVASVSLTDKAELIKNICLKHSDKTPAHIDFMDAKMFRLEVEQWLHLQ